MKLLLVFLLGAVVVGLATDHLDARSYLLVIAGAVMTTALFFFFARFWL